MRGLDPKVWPFGHFCDQKGSLTPFLAQPIAPKLESKTKLLLSGKILPEVSALFAIKEIL